MMELFSALPVPLSAVEAGEQELLNVVRQRDRPRAGYCVVTSTGALDDRVAGVVDDKSVVAGAAPHDVRAITAVDIVVAGLAAEVVVPEASEQAPVVRGEVDDGVLVVRAVEGRGDVEEGEEGSGVAGLVGSERRLQLRKGKRIAARAEERDHAELEDRV